MDGSPGTATTAASTVAPLRTLSAAHAEALEARGLDLELCVRMGLHTAPGRFGGRDGLAIPFVRSGRIVNHKYRGPGKIFAQDKDAARSFYNEDVIADATLDDLPLIITEGELDCLAMIQAGFPRTVSVPDGAGTNLDFMADVAGLADAKRIILAVDGDQAGTKLRQELGRRLGAARCGYVDYPAGCKDANDVLKAHGVAGVRALVEGYKPFPIRGLFRLSDFPEPPPLDLLETGWISLNSHLKLWRPELCVVTGIPSHGKSTWVMGLASNLALRTGARFLVASFEMPVKPYLHRMLRLHHGGSHEAADAWIEQHFFFLAEDVREEEEQIDIEWVIEKAEDAVIRHGIEWLIIDPWNQVEHQRGRASVEEYQERAIRAVKRFARAYQVGVIIVAHPTKDVKGKDGVLRPPNLYDISGSAHWYNAADHGVVVHRPSKNDPISVISVLKSRYRDAGVPGEALLRYDHRTMSYSAVPVGPGESWSMRGDDGEGR